MLSVALDCHNNSSIHTILADMNFLAIIALALLRQVVAVTVGHEQYGNIPGYFYIFSASGISIVDPITGTVNKTIASAVTAYGDAIYLEDQAQLRHYVYAARRSDNSVTVLDADTQTILTVVKVGLTPVHVYSLYYHDEVTILPRRHMILETALVHAPSYKQL
jgi:YVTN family beta-propeller protein